MTADELARHIRDVHNPATMTNADKVRAALGLTHLTRAHDDLHFVFGSDAHRAAERST